MNQSLAEFISKRLAELAAREKPLRQELDEVAREIAQLKRAAGAAGVVVEGLVDSLKREAIPAPEYARRSIPERTIKEAVVEVLRSRQSGMTALEILAAINEKFSTDYPRTSLSPQLSRLKKEGKIERAAGNAWRLTSPLVNFVETPQQISWEDALK